VVKSTSYLFGNIITDGPGSKGELGSGNSRDISIDGKAVEDLLRIKPGGTAVDIFKGIVVHEIGHNLGGVHGDPGSIMMDQQTEDDGSGTYRRTGSSVDKDGVRAIVGRIGEDYKNFASKYLTDHELRKVTDLNSSKDSSWRGTNGRIRQIP
jgi:hypothetical protein